MATYQEIFAAVLVGGLGRRLGGVEKTTLRRPHGTTLVERLVQELAPWVCEVAVVARPGQSYSLPGCRLLTDTVPNAGALAAVDAALASQIAPWCFVVACDMPRITGELVQLLAERRRPGTAVVVPRSNGLLEPTAALYATSCRGPVRAALEAGQRALGPLIQSLDYEAVDIPEALMDQLTNINTPEQLRAAGLAMDKRDRR